MYRDIKKKKNFTFFLNECLKEMKKQKLCFKSFTLFFNGYWVILTFCSNVFPQSVDFGNGNSKSIAIIVIVNCSIINVYYFAYATIMLRLHIELNEHRSTVSGTKYIFSSHLL